MIFQGFPGILLMNTIRFHQETKKASRLPSAPKVSCCCWLPSILLRHNAAFRVCSICNPFSALEKFKLTNRPTDR